MCNLFLFLVHCFWLMDDSEVLLISEVHIAGEFDMTSSLPWALIVYSIRTFCFSVNRIYDIVESSLFVFVLKSLI